MVSSWKYCEGSIMINVIKQVYDWNQKAGYLDKPYNDKLECSMLIEEALEGFNLGALAKESNLNTDNFSPREISREIVERAAEGLEHYSIPTVDKLDKQVDAAIIAIGGIAKLGLNPQEITKAINIVMNKNNEKLKNITIDEYGKVTKPEGFVGPEVELQKLLDNIKR